MSPPHPPFLHPLLLSIWSHMTHCGGIYHFLRISKCHSSKALEDSDSMLQGAPAGFQDCHQSWTLWHKTLLQ
jgi:hypothetical protein